MPLPEGAPQKPQMSTCGVLQHEHLSEILVGDEKQKERLRTTLLKKGSSLHIEAPKPEDSATYLPLHCGNTMLPKHLQTVPKP
ncbi:hypothetical protein E5288_WYG021767 [Bos mutus]|uniref:Uncharacterized protein n=1 Tax=Bos mutus TaxID=72004 RepID=A0A6B0SKU5_9CETA|nr:hypothetical protein [Bos mutus]